MQGGTFTSLESIDRTLLHRLVEANIGSILQPTCGLGIEILVVDEVSAVEEVIPDVANRTLDLSLRLGTIGTTSPQPEAPMACEGPISEFSISFPLPDGVPP